MSISWMPKCRVGTARVDPSHGSDPARPSHKTGIPSFGSIESACVCACVYVCVYVCVCACACVFIGVSIGGGQMRRSGYLIVISFSETQWASQTVLLGRVLRKMASLPDAIHQASAVSIPSPDEEKFCLPCTAKDSLIGKLELPLSASRLSP